MAVTTTSTPAKFSWADIVKNSAEPTPPAALQPSARGERRCFCQGEILVMLGHYGWIMALGDIDHEDLDKTAGRVYLNKRDVVDGETLAQGDVVSFYLYVDEQGLGAECCRLEESAANKLSADADEFVPGEPSSRPPSWNMCAAEFVPTSSINPYSLSVEAAEFVPTSTVNPYSFSVEAAEFVPTSTVFPTAAEFVSTQFSFMNSDVPEFVPAAPRPNMAVPNANVMMFNPAFLSDDESDDESVVSSGNEGDKESNGGDAESSCDESPESLQQYKDLDVSSDLDKLVLHAPWKKSGRTSSGDESTSVGTLSDSEEEGTVHCALRAPPGLSLPAGWRPPPGLSLPALVA